MSETIAYFLTWTTYGSWLPGDGRGWVDHKDGALHVPIREPNPGLKAAMARALKHDPVLLSVPERQMVAGSIRDSCRVKHWTLYALAVQSNHVHIVLSVYEVSPERVMTHLKAYASRKLNTASGRRDGQRWWTRHGSTRYVITESSLAKAVEYVERQ